MNTPLFDRSLVVADANPQTDLGAEGRIDTLDHVPQLLIYFNILRRRKWLISAIVLVAAIVGLIITLLMTPMYVSTSQIEIQRENGNITRVQGVEPEAGSVDLEFYQTQYGLLVSDAVAERVATDLRLYDDASFFALFNAPQAKQWFADGRVISNVSTRERRTRDAGAILLKHLEVTPVRLSRLVNISFSSPDPNFSARVAGAWSSTFINATLERRLDATSYARRFLEERLSQLRRRLNESEQRLVAYAQRENIINLPGTPGPNGATSERSIAADDLTSLNSALATAVSDRVQAESALAAGGSAATQSVSPTLSGLRTRRAELNGEYAKLLTQFEPGYPPAQALQDQIASLDRSINREEGRDRGTLQTAYNASVKREQNLQQRVNALKGNVLDLRRRSIQYNIFQRDVDTNRQLYDALLQRYKEIGIAGGVGVNNISVVDPAQVPLGPSSPRPLINMLIALAVGFGIGCAVALVLEQLDDALSDPAEMPHKLDLPVLGIIPDIGNEGVSESLADRKSELSEAYLAAQTSLSFSTEHGFPRSLMVTSSAPGEGKSTTAHALALSLQRTGKRVILVDGDMRSPSVHHVIQIENGKGLSNYLAGDEDLEECIHWETPGGVPTITAGPQPPNAAELLSGARFGAFIERLHRSADHIIVDAPPVMGLADAPLIGHQVEGTVFVVRAHYSRVSAARVAIRRMIASQARIMGGVLTRYDSKRSFYGYGYDYGHSYGYGTDGNRR